MLCKRNLPSQYKNHLFGLSGHNAGSFTATAFIVKSVWPGGVSIGNPAAASTRLLASIVAWAAQHVDLRFNDLLLCGAFAFDCSEPRESAA